MSAPTDADLRAQARRHAAISRAQQGLPATVQDPTVLAKVAAIITPGDTQTQAAS